MKKTMGLVLMLLLVGSICLHTIAFAEGENELEKGKQVLMASGWSEDDIDDLIPEEAVEEFADASPAITSEIKYLKVSKTGEVTELSKVACMQKVDAAKRAENLSIVSEQNRLDNPVFNRNGNIGIGDLVQQPVTTSDGYLTYYVQAYRSNSTTYILSARYEWLIKPFFNEKDVFGLGHDSQITQTGTNADVYYTYKYDLYQNNSFIKSYAVNKPTQIRVTDYGTVVSQNLAVGMPTPGTGTTTYTAKGYRGYIQYKAVKNNSNNTATSIFADYQHHQSSISYSLSINISGASVSVSPKTNYKRMSPNPYLSFSL